MGNKARNEDGSKKRGPAKTPYSKPGLDYCHCCEIYVPVELTSIKDHYSGPKHANSKAVSMLIPALTRYGIGRVVGLVKGVEGELKKYFCPEHNCALEWKHKALEQHIKIHEECAEKELIVEDALEEHIEIDEEGAKKQLIVEELVALGIGSLPGVNCTCKIANGEVIGKPCQGSFIWEGAIQSQYKPMSIVELAATFGGTYGGLGFQFLVSHLLQMRGLVFQGGIWKFIRSVHIGHLMFPIMRNCKILRNYNFCCLHCYLLLLADGTYVLAVGSW